MLRIAPEALSELAVRAFHDVSHLLRPAHLASLRAILDDPEASANDRFVALDLLKNANIAAGGVLPMCQDTGTAIVFGKKGQRVWVDGDEEEALPGASTAPTPKPTCAIRRWRRCRCRGGQHRQQSAGAVRHHGRPRRAPRRRIFLMFVAKGGGSANKTFLFQETRAILSPRSGEIPRDEDEDAGDVGLPAVPPAIVIGGTSCRTDLEDGKAGVDRWIDLPTKGDKSGHAFRDIELEQILRDFPQYRHRRAVRR